MAALLQQRRSARNPEPVRSYADQQAFERWQEEDRQRVARVLTVAAATAEPSDSSESDLMSKDCNLSNDERKTQRNSQNIPPWSAELHDNERPYCEAKPAVLLHTRRP